MANTMLDRVTNGKPMPQIEPRDEAAENMIRNLYANRREIEELRVENAALRNALKSEQADRKIAEMQVANLNTMLNAVRDIVTGNPSRRVDLSSLALHLQNADAIDNGQEVYDTEERR